MAVINKLNIFIALGCISGKVSPVPGGVGLYAYTVENENVCCKRKAIDKNKLLKIKVSSFKKYSL